MVIEKSILLKGSARRVEFKNGGHTHNFSLRIPQLVHILETWNNVLKEHGKPPTEYLNFSMPEKKEVDEFGNTHMVFCRLYSDDGKGEGSSVVSEAKPAKAESPSGADELDKLFEGTDKAPF